MLLTLASQRQEEEMAAGGEAGGEAAREVAEVNGPEVEAGVNGRAAVTLIAMDEDTRMPTSLKMQYLECQTGRIEPDRQFTSISWINYCGVGPLLSGILQDPTSNSQCNNCDERMKYLYMK